MHGAVVVNPQQTMLSTNWSVIIEVVLDMIESMDICCMLHGI